MPIKCSGRSVLTDGQTARLGWMDGQVWVGMAIQMDLYGTEAEMVNQWHTGLDWVLKKVGSEDGCASSV